MGWVATQFPEDDEIATLYAEAVMDLSPWNYWKPGGREPNPQSVPIVPTLERVLARKPDHPGAIHFYIHAVEASDRPKRAEPYADRLRGAIPGAGHLVHMPSYIYYRIGRYLDALSDNKIAVTVDRLQCRSMQRGIIAAPPKPHLGVLRELRELIRQISEEKPAVERPAHPWRTAETRIRGRFRIDTI